jgi:adenine-specific DNA methylase
VRDAPPARIEQADAADLGFLPDESVDLVLTDPPYFDNIAYGELSDFFLPWLQQLTAAPESRAASASTHTVLGGSRHDAASAAAFGTSLGQCFREIARVLRADGRVVFTYQHSTSAAWGALAGALAAAGLRPVQVFPLLGDGRAGLHAHDGNSRWDAVIVARPAPSPTAGCAGTVTISDAAAEAARLHAARWSERLMRAGMPFGAADARNLQRASLVSAALGMFAHDDGGVRTSLDEALRAAGDRSSPAAAG